MKNVTKPVTLAMILSLVWAVGAKAEISDDVVKIGVLNDMSGPYADADGKGSVTAAEMAIQEFGGRVNGKAIQLFSADHQNKPDVGTAIARRWFETEKVDAVVDLPVTSVALAVQQLAVEKGKTVMITAAATSDITSKFCSPTSSHWIDDTQTLTAGTAQAIYERGGKSWYFLTVDHAFGAALQRQVTEKVASLGGRVIGSSRFPINTSDFASFLVQAQSSGADVVALAAVGDDLSTAVKQASEFGLMNSKQIVTGLLVFITDIHALGLETAKNLTFPSAFYWDENEQTREFGRRFFQIMKKMPTKNQALTYASVKHYLRAVEATNSDDALVVNKSMRSTTVDLFGKHAELRSDGRLIYEPVLYQVKTPSESKAPWDYYKPIRTIPASEAFLPVSQKCLPQ